MNDRVLIDTYRKVEIYFDLDREKFYAAIDDPFYSKDKQSYSATKKTVDDFIKENSEFKAFEVFHIEKWSGIIKEKLKIVGIRKDGAFVCEGKDGIKKQLEKYSESDCFMESKDLIIFLKKTEVIENLFLLTKNNLLLFLKSLKTLRYLHKLKIVYLFHILFFFHLGNNYIQNE